MLWSERFAPRDWDELVCHDAINKRLQGLLAAGPGALPHTLIHGPSGSGKATRVRCILRSVLGDDAVTTFRRRVEWTGIKDLTLPMWTSGDHTEVNIRQAGSMDAQVVQSLVTELATETQSASGLEAFVEDTTLPGAPFRPPLVGFHVIVLFNAGFLTLAAQQALRRTMEIHAERCKLILVAESTNRIIPALKSRTFRVRVPAPRPEAQLAVVTRALAAHFGTEGWAAVRHATVLPTDAQLAATEGSLKRALLVAQSKAFGWASHRLLGSLRRFWRRSVLRLLLARPGVVSVTALRKPIAEALSHALDLREAVEALCLEGSASFRPHVRVAWVQACADANVAMARLGTASAHVGAVEVFDALLVTFLQLSAV